MIEATAKVENPENVRIQVSLTMALSEWNAVTDALRDARKYPCWTVVEAVTRALDKVRGMARETMEGLGG